MGEARRCTCFTVVHPTTIFPGMDYAPPLLGHPATLVILLYALVLLTLSFVGPQQLKLRLTVLLVLLAILCQFAATAPSHLHFTWLTILTAASSFLLLHYLDVGLIRRHECAKLQSVSGVGRASEQPRTQGSKHG